MFTTFTTVVPALFCAVFLVHLASAAPSALLRRQREEQRQQQPQCSVRESTNVTLGVSAGLTKFVISAADCCAYCASTESCVAAVYSNYYCHPFAAVQSVDTSPTSQLITLPATTTTTVAPTSPAPTTFAPQPPTLPPGSQELGFLVTCPGAIFCDFVNLAICVAEVVPYDSCAFDVRHNTFVSITNTTSGILRKTFQSGDCRGTAVDEVVFPWLCSYDSKQNLSRTALVEPKLNQPGKYTTTGDICTDVFCFDCPGVTFSGETGSCIANDGGHPASSSSSSSMSSAGDSSSDPAVGAANEFFYYPTLGSVVIFSYNSTRACEASDPVVGVGLTTNWCYQIGSHYYTNRAVAN